MRDSESGLERLAIGHHIWDRGHVMERSRNRHTGDREERQDYINLEESKSRSYILTTVLQNQYDHTHVSNPQVIINHLPWVKKAHGCLMAVFATVCFHC